MTVGAPVHSKGGGLKTGRTVEQAVRLGAGRPPPPFRGYPLRPLCATFCGRPRYRNAPLCREHHRHWRRTGKIISLPFYERPRVVVRFLGMTMDREAAALIRERAQERGVSDEEAASSLLEEVTLGPLVRAAEEAALSHGRAIPRSLGVALKRYGYPGAWW